MKALAIAFSVVALMFAFGCATGQPAAGGLQQAMVPIAALQPNPAAARHAAACLSDRNIRSDIDGFGFYSIYVPAGDYDRARSILRRDAESNRYWIKFVASR